MKATILPYSLSIILTKANQATVSMMTKGCMVASGVFLIFTTHIYQYFSVFFLFALVGDEPEVFFPKYFKTAILHAAHFRRVVKTRSLQRRTLKSIRNGNSLGLNCKQCSVGKLGDKHLNSSKRIVLTQ